MATITNTSPLLYLHQTRRLDLLDKVADAVADLRSAGMWIGDELAANVISQAGEDPQASEPDAY